MAFKKEVYDKNLAQAKEVLATSTLYDAYKNEELNANEADAVPMQLAGYINQKIDSSAYTEKTIQNILKEDPEHGFENLAEHAHNDLERYMYDDNSEIQEDILPQFKDNVANAENQEAAYNALITLIKNYKIDVSEALSGELAKYLMISTEDKENPGYKEAMDGIVDEYLDDVVNNSKISDKAKQRRKWFLTEHYKEVGPASMDEAKDMYAAKNQDKIIDINNICADEILKQDNKTKLEAVIGYDGLYKQVKQLLAKKQSRG